jgi:hypothetical protein
MGLYSSRPGVRRSAVAMLFSKHKFTLLVNARSHLPQMAVTNLKSTTRLLSLPPSKQWYTGLQEAHEEMAVLKTLSTSTTPKVAFAPRMANDFTQLLKRLSLTRTQIIVQMRMGEENVTGNALGVLSRDLSHTSPQVALLHPPQIRSSSPHLPPYWVLSTEVLYSRLHDQSYHTT